MSGPFDVFAGVGDQRVGTNGMEQRDHREGGFVVALENVFQREREFEFAAVMKLRCERVAVTGGFAEAVIQLKGRESFLVKEGLFDFIAVLAAADGTTAALAVKVGWQMAGRWGCGCGSGAV